MFVCLERGDLSSPAPPAVVLLWRGMQTDFACGPVCLPPPGCVSLLESSYPSLLFLASGRERLGQANCHPLERIENARLVPFRCLGSSKDRRFLPPLRVWVSAGRVYPLIFPFFSVVLVLQQECADTRCINAPPPPRPDLCEEAANLLKPTLKLLFLWDWLMVHDS